jgi:hypothetical protein
LAALFAIEELSSEDVAGAVQFSNGTSSHVTHLSLPVHSSLFLTSDFKHMRKVSSYSAPAVQFEADGTLGV